MKGIGTVYIKIFDGMAQELKEAGCVPELKRILSLLVRWKQ